ncbi:MAG TPA: prolyl oligopeptidase family serine peptidase, partial [Solirubrobacteraceae bacterium]|nr:prolyl oligopeptidase family serine peptidase [Solirubrobacteraceae bacterium]
NWWQAHVAEVTPPPRATRIPTIHERHGETTTDDYAWMRDIEAPALHEYLAAERAYYEQRATELTGLIERLAAETTARFPSGDEYSVAWPRDGFTYRTRLPAGSDNEQLLRSRDGTPGEQLLLDENELAVPTGFVELGICEPSPDGALLAWSADTSGAEIYELRIRDLSTGEDLPDVIQRSYPGVAWAADSRHLFYLVPDELFRVHQLWRHELGTAADADVLVLEEADQRFELTLHRSRSGRVAVITSASRDTTEVHVIALDAPLTAPQLLRPRQRGVEYRIDPSREAIYIVTDAGEPEFTLERAPLTSPGAEHWSPLHCPAVAPARNDTRLVHCDVLADHLLLTLRRDGATALAITDHDGGHVTDVTPQPAGTIAVAHAEEYDAGSVIVSEESLIDPPAWYRLDLDTGHRELLKRLEVPGYDPAAYRTQRLMAPAADGTPIPVTIARHHSTPLDGSAPCLLYGYGAYEDSNDPAFERSLPSLLDRGVVYAIAHIRGGGEGGRSWWQQGRLRRKPTTFGDHIAVADWLAGDAPAAAALVDGSRIVTRGASAGGLLQGAVYSMRPDRWRAVVAEVPFVDVVTTMLDPSIPLTVNEWDEWGDPRDPADHATMRSYSPYDNPPSGPRPPLLVTGAIHDPRVSIHEPAKWVARLRATDPGSPVVFRAELGVGAHSGPSGRSGRIRYEAEVQAFILAAMGIQE